jgi:hypothetical protein
MSARVSAVFANRERVLQAMRRLKEAGFTALDVMMPVADDEILEQVAPPKRSIGRLALAGGIFGIILGFGGATYCHAIWPNILVGGKPLVTVPPFMIAAFEMLILFGATMTLVGILTYCRLPQLRGDPHYDPRVPEDHYVLVVETEEDKAEAARGILREAGGEVRL